jgi:hypothetical protein
MSGKDLVTIEKRKLDYLCSVLGEEDVNERFDDIDHKISMIKLGNTEMYAIGTEVIVNVESIKDEDLGIVIVSMGQGKNRVYKKRNVYHLEFVKE